MSCNNAGQTASSTIENVGAAETIKIPVLKDTLLKYSDFCSRVDYIPLEATEQSIVGSITKLEIASDSSIIIFDARNVLLLRFGPDGKFLNHIGRVGNKDNEYIQITDFAYNPYRNEVIVMHITKSTLLYYDLDGNFLRQSKIEWPHARVSVIDDDHLGFYVGESDGDSYSYKYVITSYDGKDIIYEIPDNEPMPRISAFQLQKIYGNNGHLFCKSEFSSQISELNAGGLSPVYSIAYSDRTIPSSWLKMDYLSLYEQLSKDSERVYCIGFNETTNYYLINSAKQKGLIHLSVQERFGDKNTFSGSVAINDMFEDKVLPAIQWACYGTLKILSVHSDDVYFAQEVMPIPEKEYAEIRQQICSEVTESSEQSLLYAKWEDYYRTRQNQNIVLLKCTLK